MPAKRSSRARRLPHEKGPGDRKASADVHMPCSTLRDGLRSRIRSTSTGKSSGGMPFRILLLLKRHFASLIQPSTMLKCSSRTSSNGKSSSTFTSAISTLYAEHPPDGPSFAKCSSQSATEGCIARTRLVYRFFARSRGFARRRARRHATALQDPVEASSSMIRLSRCTLRQ